MNNKNILNKIIKYIAIGIFTFLAIRYIPTHALLDEEILMVALCVSVAYAIIDKLMPSFSNAPISNV